jgi:hypothetical protein
MPLTEIPMTRTRLRSLGWRSSSPPQPSNGYFTVRVRYTNPESDLQTNTSKKLANTTFSWLLVVFWQQM